MLDYIDSFDFGMGDATADGTMYSVIYMNNEIPQLLTWENNHLVIKDLIQIEYAELIGCEKLISYRIDDRKILE